MLLIPAGLLSRALYAAYTFDPGFDDDRVAMITIDLRGPRFEKGNATIFHDQWVDRIKALPGVEDVATARRFPLSPGRSQTTFQLDSDPDGHVVDVNTVSPNFFSVLNLPIIRGRTFADGELDAAIVTESTARRYWPGEDAIGHAINMDGKRRSIIGIAKDARVSQAQAAMSSYMYLPAASSRPQSVSVLARTREDFTRFAAAVRAETSRMDPGLVVTVRPLSDNLGLLQLLSRVTASVAGAVSLLALGLAAIGIYGVVSYVVSRRKREVGVRIALGADARDVQGLILRQTLRPVVIGVPVGVAMAAAIVQVLRSVLFGVSPYDPVAFVGAPILMLAIAAAAAFLPTRSATRIDLISVLRSE